MHKFNKKAYPHSPTPPPPGLIHFFEINNIHIKEFCYPHARILKGAFSLINWNAAKFDFWPLPFLADIICEQPLIGNIRSSPEFGGGLTTKWVRSEKRKASKAL